MGKKGSISLVARIRYTASENIYARAYDRMNPYASVYSVARPR